MSSLKPTRTMPTPRDWARTITKSLLWTLAVVLLLVGLAAVFIKPIAQSVVVNALDRRGLGPVTLEITKLGFDGISIRNVSALDGAVKLAEADVTFSINALRDEKRIDAVRIDGLQGKLVWTADGHITAGTLQVYPRPAFTEPAAPAPVATPEKNGNAPPEPQWNVRSVVVGNSQFILTLPENEIATTLNATYVQDDVNGRAFDATLNSAGNDVTATAALSVVQAGDKPAQGSGTLTYKLANLNLPMIANGLTGDGNISVSFDADGARTQDSRGDLALTFPAPPAALAAVGVKPDAPVRIALEGNNSRLFNFTLDRTKPTPTANIDGTLSLKTGSVDLKSEIKGWSDVPVGGAIPQDFHIERLNLTGKGLVFGGGTGEAFIAITDLKGPIAVAEGRMAGRITAQKLDLAEKAEASFSSAMRLDGTALSFDVSEAFAEATNLKLGSATAAGVSRVTLIEKPNTGPAPVQQVNLVLGSSPTLAVDMQMAGAMPKILTSPDAKPAVLTLPHITLSGYISQLANGTRTGAIKLATKEGRLTHGFAHLGDITADLGIDGKKIAGPVSWVLLETPDPTRPSGLDRRGANFKSNLTIDSESIEFKGNILSQNNVDVGDYSFTQTSNQSPVITLNIPVRTWAADPSFIEVFGPIAGLTNTTGTFGMDMRATPSKGGYSGTLKLAFADFGFTLGSMVVKDLNSVIALNQIWPAKAAVPQRVSFGQMVAGVPFQNGDFTIALNGDNTAKVSQAAMKLAGGAVTGSDFVVPLDGGNRSFVMNVSNVDLEGLVKAFTTDGLTATGKLSGSLPLRLQNSRLYIDKAQMVGKDGTINYRPTQAPAALSQGGGTILLQALENFQFSEVTANINGDVTKDLGVGLTLKGKNPSLYGGYPIEFNLSLDGPLNQLVREGLSGYRIPEDIKQRLTQQGIKAP